MNKNLEPANVIDTDKPFFDKISGWINIRQREIADYYEKENGKLVKKMILPFDEKKGKLFGKYLILKEADTVDTRSMKKV